MIDVLTVAAISGWALAFFYWAAYRMQKQTTHDTEAIAMAEITKAVDRAFDSGVEIGRKAEAASNVTFLSDRQAVDFVRPRGCQLN